MRVSALRPGCSQPGGGALSSSWMQIQFLFLGPALSTTCPHVSDATSRMGLHSPPATPAASPPQSQAARPFTHTATWSYKSDHKPNGSPPLHHGRPGAWRGSAQTSSPTSWRGGGGCGDHRSPKARGRARLRSTAQSCPITLELVGACRCHVAEMILSSTTMRQFSSMTKTSCWELAGRDHELVLDSNRLA